MALQYDFNNNTGVAHPLAYARVVMVQLLQDQNRAELGVEIFHNAASRSGNFVPVERRGFTVLDLPEVPAVLDGDGLEITPAVPSDLAWTDLFEDAKLKAASKSPVTQAYEWLKVQPEFMASLDV